VPPKNAIGNNHSIKLHPSQNGCILCISTGIIIGCTFCTMFLTYLEH